MSDDPKYAEMMREWRQDLRKMGRPKSAAQPFRGRFGREPLPSNLKVWSETGEITTFPIFSGHVT